MQYVSLYRKYRPSSFEEVVGQDHIIKTLTNSIINNKMAHAYLFAGPRGTGKTSVAKLIAKIINCENRKGIVFCDECNSCVSFNEKNNPDIIEMDAASNNGVDEIREIKNHVGLLPTMSKYKIYIIDEVHMLSTGAFNALLKTLEEPPEHVIFILATTELHKVPDTIVSRCQIYEFERISDEEIVNKLNFICEKEQIKCSEEVLFSIAKYSYGGLRDAIGILDKLSVYSNNIDIDMFYEIKGILSNEDINIFVEDILNKDITKIVKMFEKIRCSSINIDNLVIKMLEIFKEKLIKGVKDNSNLNKFLFEIIEILNKGLIDLKSTMYPQVLFEVNILKIVDLLNEKIENQEVYSNFKMIDKPVKEVSLLEKLENKEKEKEYEIFNKNDLQEENVENKSETKKAENKEDILDEIRKIRINNTFCNPNKKLVEDLRIKWINLSDFINEEEYSKISSFVVDAYICAASQSNLILKVEYSSIVNNAMSNIKKIEALIEKVLNNNYKVVFITNEEWDKILKEYKENLKNGNLNNYKFIEEKEIHEKIKKTKKNSKIVNNAKSLFDDGIIEVK